VFGVPAEGSCSVLGMEGIAQMGDARLKELVAPDRSWRRGAVLRTGLGYSGRDTES